MQIAVIGTGIAGLGAAHALADVHDIEVFEADARPGGHAHTVTVPRTGAPDLALDTGFLVHNVRNYPLLTRLFGDLGVATQPSEMSFSVTCTRCGLSYAGRDLWSQRAAVRDPRMRRLGAQIARFAAIAGRWRDGRHRTRTLAQFVAHEGFSADFRDHFLIPFTAAIWSMSPGDALAFPADDALTFFDNHRVLALRRHTWRTVVGGSQTYVARILDPLGDRVHLNTPVVGVARRTSHLEVRTRDGTSHRFDAVVIATHSDQALSLLDRPTAREAAVLGDITYTPNVSVLHTDERLLPPPGAVRASWNYLIDDCRDPDRPPTMTYLLNRLQRLDSAAQYQVTLNRTDIAPEHVIARIPVAHPCYSFRALRAQSRLPQIDGADRIWFAGAYHRHGFHEDGLRAGVAAARALGSRW